MIIVSAILSGSRYLSKSYTGSDAWVEISLFSIRSCLTGDGFPPPAEDCDYCAYRRVAQEAISALPSACQG